MKKKPFRYGKVFFVLRMLLFCSNLKKPFIAEGLFLKYIQLGLPFNHTKCFQVFALRYNNVINTRRIIIP